MFTPSPQKGQTAENSGNSDSGKDAASAGSSRILENQIAQLDVNQNQESYQQAETVLVDSQNMLDLNKADISVKNNYNCLTDYKNDRENYLSSINNNKNICSETKIKNKSIIRFTELWSNIWINKYPNKNNKINCFYNSSENHSCVYCQNIDKIWP